jgi:hypothetical protein
LSPKQKVQQFELTIRPIKGIENEFQEFYDQNSLKQQEDQT